MLLSPEVIQMNMNLIRIQLKSLLDDILDDATPKDQGKTQKLINGYCQMNFEQNEKVLNKCYLNTMIVIINGVIIDDANNKLFIDNQTSLIKHMKENNINGFVEDFMKYKESVDECQYKRDGILSDSFAELY